MIIRSMSANFGVLSNVSLDLEPGLNILQAPNESGKSTWCALLRVMLYGPETLRGSRAGRLPDRERYAPWDGTPMWGRMDLTWQGKDITLRRSGANGPMRDFSAVYTGTGEPVSALHAADTGEQLTGLPEEVFRRTAFIGPAGLAVGQGQELEKWLAATVSSGEEGISYSEAAARLKGWQRQYRYRNQGLIPETENELRELRAQCSEAESLRAELDELSARERELMNDYTELAGRAGLPAGEQRKLRLQQELLEMEGEILRRESEAETLRASLRRDPLWDTEPDEAFLAAAEEDRRRAAKLKSRLSRRTGTPSYRLLLPALGVLLGLAAIWSLWLLIPALLCLGAAAGLWISGCRSAAAVRRTERELDGLLRRYGADTPREIRSHAENYAELWREMTSLQAAAEELRTRTRQLEVDGKLPAAEGEGSRELTQAGEELRALLARRARVQDRLEAMGTEEETGRRIAEKENRLRELERRAAALELAAEELAAADEEMHSLIAPGISRRTESFFRQLTGERYGELALDQKLQASVQRAGDALPHAESFLSRGTRDQLYLALRLALCSMTPVGAEPCPIILDDALISFDDERLGLAIDCLSELAAERQILLFTCQGRELRALRSKKSGA
ncbi:MAG: hypothetical protein IKQ10_11555 [Oscillospiraceae bacterium]|nr:hypothetical protein [Oscillospiraceae bacterium]